MKDTPLLKLLDEIEGYRPIAGTDPFPYIIAKLHSLLPYERECFEETYSDGFERPDNNYIDFKDYFYKIYKQ